MWIIYGIIGYMQLLIFFRTFKNRYGTLENFFEVQKRNGAKLRKYKRMYYRFMLDMQFNKTIIMPYDELEYMRKYVYVPYVLSWIEFCLIIMILLLKVVI